MPLFFLVLPILISCNKDLNVNAEWKDITVVYGLLDQSEDTTFIKITKAFLGEGNALMFSKVPDSSTYPDVLDVNLEEYDNNGTTYITTHPCDGITIHDKVAGDTIFYYPNQFMYYCADKLHNDRVYKLKIRNKVSGKEISAQTSLVSDFEVFRPNGTASFIPTKPFNVKWKSRSNGNGKRYQLVIRFIYQEILKSDPNGPRVKKYIDWTLFNSIKTVDPTISETFDKFYPGDLFYSVVGSRIMPNPLVDRVAYKCIYYFTVGAPELSTYMDITEPSLSLVQEKPAYTNITNGIGLFSSRFMKQWPSRDTINNTLDSLDISQVTKDSLRVNVHTRNLGF